MHPKLRRDACSLLPRLAYAFAILCPLFASSALSQEISNRPLDPQKPLERFLPRPKLPPEVAGHLLNGSDAHLFAYGGSNLDLVKQVIPNFELSLKVRLLYQGKEWWETVDLQRAVEDLKRLLILSSDQRADLKKASLIRSKPLLEAGKFEEAIDAEQEKCKLVLEVLGPNHPDYISSLEELGSVYESAGRYDDADKQYLTSLKLFKSILGEHHPLYVDNLERLGKLFFRKKQYAQAEIYLRESLDGYDFIGGTCFVESISGVVSCDPLRSLLVLYNSINEYSRAIALLQQWTEAVGPSDPRYADNISRLAHFYKLAGQVDQAELLLKKISPDEPAVTNDTSPASNPQDWAPSPTPQLPTAVLAEVKAKEKQINIVLTGKAKPPEIEQAKIDASFVMQTRREYQGDDWWETVNAGWMLTGLNQIASLTPEQLETLTSSYSKFKELEYATVDDPFNDLLAQCERRGELLGQNNPAYARCLSESVVLRPQPSSDERAETERVIRKAIDLIKKSLGDNHPDYAHSLGVLAHFSRLSKETKLK